MLSRRAARNIRQGSNGAEQRVQLSKRRPGLKVWIGVLVAVVATAFASAETTAKDRYPPKVSISSPAPGSTVAGRVTVSATATDNVGVVRVELLVNGVTAASDSATPYTFTWDSTQAANGQVTLAVKAYDAGGKNATASVTVTVANTTSDTQAPNVTIETPSTGATLAGRVTVNANASDNVGVMRVDFMLNGAKFASSTTAPYTATLDTTQTADGSAILSTQAYDQAGNSSTASINTSIANTTTTIAPAQPTLTVSTLNSASSVSVHVYPTDLTGIGDGYTAMTRTYTANSRVWLSAALRSGNNYFVKWQKDGADYDTASATSVVVDTNHTLTAVYATPSCSGVAVYPGTNNLKNAVAGSPAGTTFCIKAGVHRLTSSVYARTNDKYIGESGAILNGSKILTSFYQAGSYWVAGGQYQREPTAPPLNCSPSAPACIYPEKVFFDGKDLWQVATLSALGPGTFYFDYANAQIYLYDNPTGHLIEATTGSGGIVGFSGGGGDSVTVRNLIFEKFGGGYVSDSSHNVLKAMNGWVVENNEVRSNSGVGIASYGTAVVRNNYIHHNGQYGIKGIGTFLGNNISYNNTDGNDVSTDAGGSKFLRSVGLKLRGNVVSNNTGRGFWSDYDNLNATVENNFIESNTAEGIFHEVSCAAIIRNNVLRNNNTINAGLSAWHGAQIYTRTSQNVEIYGNAVDSRGTGGNAIAIRRDSLSYTGTNCGALDSRNNSIHDNVVWMDSTDNTGIVGGGANIAFWNNKYHVQDLAALNFVNGVKLTIAQWQAAGQDTGSSFVKY